MDLELVFKPVVIEYKIPIEEADFVALLKREASPRQKKLDLYDDLMNIKGVQDVDYGGKPGNFIFVTVSYGDGDTRIKGLIQEQIIRHLNEDREGELYTLPTSSPLDKKIKRHPSKMEEKS